MRKYLLISAVVLAGCGVSKDDGSRATADDAALAGDDDAAPGGGSDFDSCAEASYAGEQVPAAMMVVLDKSSSMAQGGKWTAAAQAIVQALDKDVFDSIHLGLYAAPSSSLTGPSCIFGLPVSCLAPPFPQIDLLLAGSAKSTDSVGVRPAIKNWFNSNAPDTGIGDASPLYDALVNAITTLQGWPVGGERILFVVTDGSISCGQFSNRPGFSDCNECDHDWEHPDNIVGLLQDAYSSSTPVHSFIVGVPGADTNDATGCEFPPYSMRLALSSMAYAGAPDFAPAGCDGTSFTQAGADPTTSCHFDMTQGFTAQDMADAIAEVRGQVVGCTYELPEPPDGEAIDPNEINVQITVDGVTTDVPRRTAPGESCEDVDCWDYDDAQDITILGQACDKLGSATTAEVKIIVGCTTIVL